MTPIHDGLRSTYECDCGYSTERKPRSQARAEIEAHLAVANKRK